jgi:hypothetical protein
MSNDGTTPRGTGATKGTGEAAGFNTPADGLLDGWQRAWRAEEPSTIVLRYSMALCVREAREEQWDSCGGS